MNAEFREIAIFFLFLSLICHFQREITKMITIQVEFAKIKLTLVMFLLKNGNLGILSEFSPSMLQNKLLNKLYVNSYFC